VTTNGAKLGIRGRGPKSELGFREGSLSAFISDFLVEHSGDPELTTPENIRKVSDEQYPGLKDDQFLSALDYAVGKLRKAGWGMSIQKFWVATAPKEPVA